METATTVKVAARIRPLVPAEAKDGASHGSVAALPETGSVIIGSGATEKTFGFDYTFGPTTDNAAFYEGCVAPLVGKAMQGFNVTIFAYGQTCSGKTFTMMEGYNALANGGRVPSATYGVTPRLLQDVFAALQHSGTGAAVVSSKVRVSCLEIYNEQVFDLLSSDASTRAAKDVVIRDNDAGEVVVTGLTELPVATPSDAAAALARGLASRATASTGMNARSSRSHAIFTLHLEQVVAEEEDGGTGDEGDADVDGDHDGDESMSGGSGKAGAASASSSSSAGGAASSASDGGRILRRVSSRIHLVDLAGSERAKRTGAQGARLREAASINKGLLALGNVINALAGLEDAAPGKAAAGSGAASSSAAAPAATHIPFRDSKLTRLLKSSLGGNACTLMIACCSPADANLEETLSTLRYASRARSIKNRAVVNVDPMSAELTALRKRVKDLEDALVVAQGQMGGMVMGGDDSNAGAPLLNVAATATRRDSHGHHLLACRCGQRLCVPCGGSTAAAAAPASGGGAPATAGSTPAGTYAVLSDDDILNGLELSDVRARMDAAASRASKAERLHAAAEARAASLNDALQQLGDDYGSMMAEAETAEAARDAAESALRDLLSACQVALAKADGVTTSSSAAAGGKLDERFVLNLLSDIKMAVSKAEAQDLLNKSRATQPESQVDWAAVDLDLDDLAAGTSSAADGSAASTAAAALSPRSHLRQARMQLQSASSTAAGAASGSSSSTSSSASGRVSARSNSRNASSHLAGIGESAEEEVLMSTADVIDDDEIMMAVSSSRQSPQTVAPSARASRGAASVAADQLATAATADEPTLLETIEEQASVRAAYMEAKRALEAKQRLLAAAQASFGAEDADDHRAADASAAASSSTASTSSAASALAAAVRERQLTAYEAEMHTIVAERDELQACLDQLLAVQVAGGAALAVEASAASAGPATAAPKAAVAKAPPAPPMIGGRITASAAVQPSATHTLQVKELQLKLRASEDKIARLQACIRDVQSRAAVTVARRSDLRLETLAAEVAELKAAKSGLYLRVREANARAQQERLQAQIQMRRIAGRSAQQELDHQRTAKELEGERIRVRKQADALAALQREVQSLKERTGGTARAVASGASRAGVLGPAGGIAAGTTFAAQFARGVSASLAPRAGVDASVIDDVHFTKAVANAVMGSIAGTRDITFSAGVARSMHRLGDAFLEADIGDDVHPREAAGQSAAAEAGQAFNPLVALTDCMSSSRHHRDLPLEVKRKLEALVGGQATLHHLQRLMDRLTEERRLVAAELDALGPSVTSAFTSETDKLRAQLQQQRHVLGYQIHDTGKCMVAVTSRIEELLGTAPGNRRNHRMLSSTTLTNDVALKALVWLSHVAVELTAKCDALNERVNDERTARSRELLSHQSEMKRLLRQMHEADARAADIVRANDLHVAQALHAKLDGFDTDKAGVLHAKLLPAVEAIQSRLEAAAPSTSAAAKTKSALLAAELRVAEVEEEMAHLKDQLALVQATGADLTAFAVPEAAVVRLPSLDDVAIAAHPGGGVAAAAEADAAAAAADAASVASDALPDYIDEESDEEEDSDDFDDDDDDDDDEYVAAPKRSKQAATAGRRGKAPAKAAGPSPAKRRRIQADDDGDEAVDVTAASVKPARPKEAKDHCGCKTNCSTNRCACRAAGRSCGVKCKACKSCVNGKHDHGAPPPEPAAVVPPSTTATAIVAGPSAAADGSTDASPVDSHDIMPMDEAVVTARLAGAQPAGPRAQEHAAVHDVSDGDIVPMPASAMTSATVGNPASAAAAPPAGASISVSGFKRSRPALSAISGVSNAAPRAAPQGVAAIKPVVTINRVPATAAKPVAPVASSSTTGSVVPSVGVSRPAAAGGLLAAAASGVMRSTAVHSSTVRSVPSSASLGSTSTGSSTGSVRPVSAFGGAPAPPRAASVLAPARALSSTVARPPSTGAPPPMMAASALRKV